jgi:hypothetical protein
MAAVCMQVILVPPLHSGEYTLKDGWHDEVCRAYLKYLKAYDKEPCALACERPYNPNFPQFTKPEWKSLDPWPYREFLWQMERESYQLEEAPEDYDRRKGQRMREIEEAIKAGTITLKESFFDVTGDGKPDRVLRYEFKKCDPCSEMDSWHPTGRLHYVVREDGTLDLDTLFYSQGGQSDFFFYRGKVYYDYYFGEPWAWEDHIAKVGWLYVYGPFSVRELTRRLCEFDYMRVPAKKKKPK